MTLKKQILLLGFTLLLSLFSYSVNAKGSKDSLVGNWASNKIQLNLKSNHRYVYSVKILGIKKTFKGSWSTKTVTKKSGKKTHTLVLNYNLFGKRKKTALYSFSKGRLKLIQKGKVHYLKRK